MRKSPFLKEYAMEKTTIGELTSLRFCKTCKLEKPPKASHCKYCNNCVKNFDHHCFFIGNCIGRRNHKYFLLFLFFGLLKSLFGLFSAIFTTVDVFYTNWDYQVQRFGEIRLFLAVIPILLVLLIISSKLKFDKFHSYLGTIIIAYVSLVVLYGHFTCILDYYEKLSLHLLTGFVFSITLFQFVMHLKSQLFLIKIDMTYKEYLKVKLTEDRRKAKVKCNVFWGNLQKFMNKEVPPSDLI